VSSRREGLVARLRRRLGGDPPAPAPGEPRLVAAEGALRRFEARFCDAIHVQRDGRAPGRGSPLAGERIHDGARAAIATASGHAMAGARTAAFISGDGLIEAREALAAAAARSLPFIVHAVVEPHGPGDPGAPTGHGGYHAVAECGAFQVLAATGQEALDLAVTARWIAESSLLPGVVAVDGLETARAVQDLRVHEGDEVRELLGAAADEIETPTPAQELLFGGRRRRLPRFVDLDRPVSVGGAVRSEDHAAWLVGRRAFFADHVREIAAQAMGDVARMTGRPLGFVRRHRLRDARWVLVAQGSLIETAEAVADHLRESEGWPVGVLGLTWLRPFPEQEVRAALADVEAATVLEWIGAPFAGPPPLLRELRAALGRGETRLSSAICGLGGQPAGVGDLAEVCRRMQGETAPMSLFLGVRPPALSSTHPKREALLQRVRREYRDLELVTPASAEAIDLRVPGSITLLLHGRRADLVDARLLGVAEVLKTIRGPHVRASSREERPECWVARVTSGPHPPLPIGDSAPVDAALVFDAGAGPEPNPVRRVLRRGLMLLSTSRSGEEAWRELPASWRRGVR
jgi:pyruvate-ferredoxin/flavodoxin oxidoreductase